MGRNNQSDNNTTGFQPLKIGVTGHRFLVELDKLKAGIEQALDLLEDVFPQRELWLYSTLAEGADRLVAHALLKRNPLGLIMVLPLPQVEYEQYFTIDASLAEFRGLLVQAREVVQLPPVSSREDAYAQGGMYLVDHCDAIITLWDGAEVQGRGGTAEVVMAAMDHNLPVLHILTGNRKPGTTEPTSSGPDQGRLIVHNLPARS